MPSSNWTLGARDFAGRTPNQEIGEKAKVRTAQLHLVVALMGGFLAPTGSAADRRRLRAHVRAGAMASDENEPDEEEADEDEAGETEGGPNAANGDLSSAGTQPERHNSTPSPQQPTTSPVATTSSIADTEPPTTTTPPLTTTAPPETSTTTAPTPSPGLTPSPTSPDESPSGESSSALQSIASRDGAGSPVGKSRLMRGYRDGQPQSDDPLL